MSTEKNIQNIMDLIRRDDSVDAPNDSIRWASNLFRTRAVETKPSLVKRMAAVLQMEIAPNKPAFGERSASASAVRQLLYQADGNAVDVRIEKAKKGFTIRGQILGDGFANAAIGLNGEDRSFVASANDTSEFRFDSVPAGQYELTIRTETLEITLKAIDVS
jgi:hypothetical protein